MVRKIPLFLACLAAAAPALAAAPHYRAEPAAAPAADRLVVRDTAWRCNAAACWAPAMNSRPALVCAALVRELGALKSFTVAGQPLPADALEKCNARAR